MTRYYDELASFERDGFQVIVDKTWEDLDPWDQLSDCFPNKQALYNDIDSGRYEWFMLRVRVFVEGLELGSAYLGGMLYEDAAECLKDGTAEDMIQEALAEAKKDVYRLKQRFAELSDQIDREGVDA